MITVVGGIKGGSGKTTVATNLVVIKSELNQKVLFVDADEQRSASDWAEQRAALNIETNWTTIRLTGKLLHSELKKLKDQYDEIVIDVGGRDTTSQRSALLLADYFVIPFKPRTFDIWTIGHVNTLLSEAMVYNEKMKPLAFINQADPKGTTNDEARSILKDSQHLEVLLTTLGNRKAYSHAATEGMGVTELKKQDLKASEEIRSLYDEVYKTHIF